MALVPGRHGRMIPIGAAALHVLAEYGPGAIRAGRRVGEAITEFTRPPKRARPTTTTTTTKAPTTTTTTTTAAPRALNTMANAHDEVPVKPFGKAVAKACPDYFNIRLPFSSVNRETSALASRGFHIMRLNSIWDPDLSSPGAAQPMGRDTWAGIYQYYRVLYADVKITFMNNGNPIADDTWSDTLLVGYQVVEDYTTQGASTVRGMLEGKRCASAILTAPGLHQTGDSAVMQYTFDPLKFHHHVSELGPEERWTPVGQNPAVNRQLIINYFNLHEATRFDVTYVVEINYAVQFRECSNSIITAPDTDE